MWKLKNGGVLNEQHSEKTYWYQLGSQLAAAEANCFYSSTQGNYVTRDSNDMCHLMPRLHMPDWREEDERTFVHCGS